MQSIIKWSCCQMSSMIVKAIEVWFWGWRRMMTSLHIRSLLFISETNYYFVHFVMQGK